MHDTTESTITCPACGSLAQVRLITYLSRLRHAMGQDPRVSLFFCLKCGDYYEEEGEER